MISTSGNGDNPWWRNWRLWALVWVIGTVGLLAILWWDARLWLQNAPQATFRTTKLNVWPLEILWWLFVPVVLLVQQSLWLLDRRLHRALAAKSEGAAP